MRTRWRALVLLALTSSGCALLSLDLDALHANVGVSPEGGTDADAADAIGPGAADARAEGSVAEPYCSYQDLAQTFCDDFDTDRQPWTRRVETGAGGRLALDAVEPSSKPRSLIAAQDADDPGATPFARYLEKEFSTRSTAVSLIGVVRLDRVEGAGFDAFEVVLGNLSVSLTIEPLRTVLRQRLVGDRTVLKETQLGVEPRIGKWEPIELVISFIGRSVVMDLAGDVAEESMPAEATSSNTNGPVVRLGIVATAGPGRISIGYDDVLFLDK